jgi:serine/threonine protein kinase
MPSLTEDVQEILTHVKKGDSLPAKSLKRFLSFKSVPSDVKERVRLYNTIVQLGKGFKITYGNDREAAFVIADGNDEKEVQHASNFLAVSTTNDQQSCSNMAEVDIEGKKYTVDTYNQLGQGTFATVYVLKPTEDNLVVKVFKEQNIDVIKENLNALIKHFINTPILSPNRTTLKLTNGTFKFVNVKLAPFLPVQVAYAMQRREGSLKGFLYTPFENIKHLPPDARYDAILMKLTEPFVTSMAKLFIDAKNTLSDYKCHFCNVQKRFVHGDIKLENIMYEGENTFIHDWDGVFLYDADTLLHHEEIPYTKGCMLTPSSTHPFLVWYIHTLRNATSQGDLIGKLKGSINNNMQLWKMMFSLGGNSQILGILEGVINEKYKNGYDDFIKNEVFTQSDEVIVDWMKSQLLYCDIFALGISLLFHYILIYNFETIGLSSIQKEKIEELLNPLYDLAYYCIDESLLTSSSITQKGGGTTCTLCTRRTTLNFMLKKNTYYRKYPTAKMDKPQQFKKNLKTYIESMNVQDQQKLKESIEKNMQTVYYFPSSNKCDIQQLK